MEGRNMEGKEEREGREGREEKEGREGREGRRKGGAPFSLISLEYNLASKQCGLCGAWLVQI